MKRILLIYIYILPASLHAQQFATHPAHIITANSNQQISASSFIYNPASLGQLPSTLAGAYATRRFLLPELGSFMLAMALNTSIGNAGLYIDRFGNADFSRSRIGLAYGRPLAKSLDAGAGFYYQSAKIAAYGSDAAIGTILQTGIRLTSQFVVSAAVENIVGGRYAKSADEHLPRIFFFGFGYDAGKDCYFGLTAAREENRPVNILAGIRYRPVPSCILSIGIQSLSGEWWIGAGFMRKKILLEIITNYHPVLGISPTLGISFQLNKKEK